MIMEEYIAKKAIHKMLDEMLDINIGIGAMLSEDCVRELINDTPAANVVEVVRCKDCVWWEHNTYGSLIGRCENPRNGLVNEYTDDTDYCSYGERKQ
jgi:hypothetical protein